MKRDPITGQRLVAGFALVVRIGLGCMFLYSSLPKIRQPYDFLSSVYNYELVGPRNRHSCPLHFSTSRA